MENYVCLNCCDINFEAYFGLSPDHPAIPSISLKSALASAESCPFCGLLVTATSQLSGRSQTTPHRAWPQPTSDNQSLVFYFEREYRQPVRDERNVHICGGGVMKVKLHPPPIPLSGESLLFKICPVFTCPTEELADLQHSARFVAEDQIDLTLCHQWLQACEEHHPEICRDHGMLEREQALPTEFRLIDVVNQCVSRQPLTSRYIALSYVWGQVETLQLRLSTVADLETKHSLHKHKSELAQTVSDAMEVVRSMGETYLWVDCLCIIQDAPDLDLHIGCMDKIYGAAIISIVASSGGDANAGLAGVRSGSRSVAQLTREVWPDLELAVSLPTPNELTSPWESRGWTFQEQMLSRRFLIFREGQVVWQCPTHILCEDTSTMDKVRPFHRLRQVPKSWLDEGAKPQQLSTILWEPKPLRRPNAFAEYGSIVAEYTQKQLSYPNDILRAFDGLSRILNQYFGSQFISGLPETYLDAALLWIPRTVLERRPGLNGGFPSWSWTGWMGATGFEDAVDSRLEKIVPLIRWYYKKGNSPAILVNDIGIGIDETKFTSAKSVNTCLWFPLFEVLAAQIGSLPDIDVPHDEHLYLQFWTSCAFFTITSNQNNARDAFQSSITGRKPKCVLIRSSRNQVIGYLTLAGVQPHETRVNDHEFIIVSEAQVSGFNPVTWEIKYSDKCLMYNVLLVEWDQAHQIVTRLGIGRVLKGAWKEAGSRIKFVTLS